ncbi:nuclear transport factor 2 family protein [Pseudothauera rhizosphaerae]|uniref:Tetratricopeptide repeat protein n=1 Tax=Pseudothauera rhizosphaerae TaxID=2565932 RepID=A0A4S4ARR4_9RHOO|nr:tetratricopeptide repeat protein [Pseudothauera rhizosphaerae]THF62511.1 tetratricopeptide repeat protein [Pseudothauera rhizosphaerae]
MRIRASAALGALAVVVALGFSTTARAANDNREVSDLLQRGQHERALVIADRLIAADPRNAEARFLRGIALAELDRPAEAIAVFRKLTEDFPNLPEPYNNLAVLYARQRDYDKARTALEQAIRTHPSYATAHANLGDLYARLASEAYDRALKLDAGQGTGQWSTQPPLALIRTLEPAATPPLSVASATPAPAQPVSAKPAPAKPAAAASPAPGAAPAARPAQAPAAAEPVASSALPAKPASAAPAAPPPTATAAAVQTPAAAKPAAETGQTDAVLAAVQSWAAAWAGKEVDRYLAAYDKDFEVPGGRARSDWENERRQRIARPASISVEIDNPRVRIDGERAEVRFLQRYRASNYKANTIKILELVRRGDRWRIARETVGK